MRVGIRNWNTDRCAGSSGYRRLSDHASLNTAMTGSLSLANCSWVCSKPRPPHHRMPTMLGSPASSLYAFTPLAGSMPVSRLTSAIFLPRMPPRALSSCAAALSEFVVTVPMNAPMPEKGAITPTFRVSPLAPAMFFELPPDPHAARTAPERLTAAAARDTPPAARADPRLAGPLDELSAGYVLVDLPLDEVAFLVRIHSPR